MVLRVMSVSNRALNIDEISSIYQALYLQQNIYIQTI